MSTVSDKTRYGLLAGFVAIMVAALMLDKPNKLNTITEPLFPSIDDPTQIYQMEVLDVTRGRGILLVRDDAGLWYAPTVPDIQESLSSGDLDQVAVENAATAIWLMDGGQWYENTKSRQSSFGLATPDFFFQFRAREPNGRATESVVFQIGDVNPENATYYVWPQGDTRIYLIRKPIVDMLLNLLNSPSSIAPAPEQTPTVTEGNAPAP